MGGVKLKARSIELKGKKTDLTGNGKSLMSSKVPHQHYFHRFLTSIEVVLFHVDIQRTADGVETEMAVVCLNECGCRRGGGGGSVCAAMRMKAKQNQEEAFKLGSLRWVFGK